MHEASAIYGAGNGNRVNHATLIRARLVVQVHPGPPFKSPVNTRLFSLFHFRRILSRNQFANYLPTLGLAGWHYTQGWRECCPVMSKDLQGSARHCKAVDGAGSHSWSVC